MESGPLHEECFSVLHFRRRLSSFLPFAFRVTVAKESCKVRTGMEFKLGNGPDGLDGFVFQLLRDGEKLVMRY